MTNEYNIAEEFFIEDLDTLKVLADSRRLSILKAIGPQPLTVKQIAKRVKLPATKLYYHINMMEKHNIIQVTETRVVSGIIEKLYTVTAKTYKPGLGLLTAGDVETNTQALETMVFSVMDNVREELIRSFQAGIATLKESDDPYRRIDIASMVIEMTDEEIAEFERRYYELFTEMCGEGRPERPDREQYNFFFVRFPRHNYEDDDAE